MRSVRIRSGTEGRGRASCQEDVVEGESAEARAVEETRTPRRCSRCNQSGHTSRTCKTDKE
ncbi:hypothetical protein V1506DRAFT_543955 [Lipomyces tetrasporus]